MHNKKVYVWGCFILVSLVIGWLTPVIRVSLPVVIAKLYGISLLPYLWMFVIPAFVSEKYEVIVPFLKKYWWTFLGALLIMKYILHWDVDMGLYPLLGTLFLFGSIIGFAYTFPQLTIKTDISYGIYIYHMTVVNALIALGFVEQSWTLCFLIVMTCLLAWVSTMMMKAIKFRV